MTNIDHNSTSLGRHYLLATDGACIGNPGPGGWGAVLQLREGDTVVRQLPKAGSQPNTTNNRMELEAAILPLSRLQEPDLPVVVLSDSQYLVKGMSEWLTGWKAKGWRASGKPVKNRDLWEELDRMNALRPIIWTWVRGHNGHRLNEMAHTLASNAAAGVYRTRSVLETHPDWTI